MVFDVVQTWVYGTLDKQVALATSPETRFKWLYTKAKLMVDGRQWALAQASLQNAVDIFEAEMGCDVAQAQGWEALMYLGVAQVKQFLGRDKWESIFSLASPQLERTLGPTHPTTLLLKMYVAEAYCLVGDYAVGMAMLWQCYHLQQRGPQGKNRYITMGILGQYLLKQSQDLKQAEHMLLQAHEGLTECLGANHRDTATTANNLAICYMSQGRYLDALAVQEATHAGKSVFARVFWGYRACFTMSNQIWGYCACDYLN